MPIDKISGQDWADISKVSAISSTSIANVSGIASPSTPVGPTPFFNLDAQESTSYGGKGTTWVDIAGGNNVALTNGPTFTNNQGSSTIPSYFTFDGINDYAIDGTTLTGFGAADSWTFETWFLTTARMSQSTDLSYIYSKGASNYTLGMALSVYGRSGYRGLLFRFSSSTSSYADFKTSTNIKSLLNNGVWNQIIFSKDAGSGTTPQFYLNGVNYAGTIAGGLTPLTLDQSFNNSDTLYASAYRGNTTYGWDGRLGAIRWYDTYFDATQALANYNSQKTAYGK